MIVLGIDPGVATVGFGIISANNGEIKPRRYGVISTPAKMRLALRLKQINNDVAELIKTFKPDAIAVEELFFNTNQKTALSVAQGRAAVILAGEEHGIPMYEYTPLQVKKAVTGYGRADKKQVMEMVQRLLALEAIPKPDDAADALAIAICHARTSSSLLTIEGGNVCSTI
ncbi:MAG: crossover junction endodeoxyribonuclease RuvC [Oscillospiraceae bacterium]|nr:crossover junction endodeoxyribonuclease RuvC [Oscillospiraceae bacterium]MCL2278202.1 crossover junction endodeoxyribonuclease RuvC [Oscillospiraceae bacterium]